MEIKQRGICTITDLPWGDIVHLTVVLPEEGTAEEEEVHLEEARLGGVHLEEDMGVRSMEAFWCGISP
jgi:hypothetical protein